MEERAGAYAADFVDHEQARRIAVWEETHLLVTTLVELDPRVCQQTCMKFAHPPRHLPTPAIVENIGARVSMYQRIKISQRDCVLAAMELAQPGKPPPMLMDAGSRGHFGGGYENGARAQEEELCRRSNLAHCVDPQHGQAALFHPLEPTGCVYVPSVQFFRAGIEDDYAVCMLEDKSMNKVRSTSLAVGIVSATRNPVLVSGKLRSDIATSTQEAISNFLHCARAYGHTDVVLVPLGCGAYRNPPSHIAALFDTALCELLPDGRMLGECFDQITFAVLDFPMGQPPAMTDNFCMFAHFFGSRGASVSDESGSVVDYRSLRRRS